MNMVDYEQEVMEEGSKKQRKKNEEMMHMESVDSVAKCPKCQSNKVNWVFTKRGVSLKCMNCGFDTHFLQDVLSHRKRELEVLPILKKMFPMLIFKENVPIDTDVFSGETGIAHTRYDFGCYWFGKKIAKCKVSVLRNTTREHYLTAEKQYIQGREKVFDYLAKIDAIMIFYFVDEPDEMKKIAMASCREMRKFATMVIDEFKNEQYHLPKEIRKLIIKTDFQDFKNLLFRRFFDIITEGTYIV
jgi:Zn ribbon nucleic-acid-binding protein